MSDDDKPADAEPARGPLKRAAHGVGSAAVGVGKGVGHAAAAVGSGSLRGTRAFATGLRCTLGGLTRLFRTPKLWPYAIAPVVLSLAVFVGVFWWLIGSGTAWAEQTAAQGLGEWSAAIAWWISLVVLIVFSVVMLYVIFPAVVRVVAAPFLALLADRVVADVIGREPPVLPGSKFVRWIVRPLVDAIVVVGVRLVVTVIALPLNCIPVVGSGAFFAVLMPLEGMDLLDLAQSARAVPLGKRLRFVARHAVAAGGLGLGTAGVLLIPFVNVFLLPSLVVSAVLLDQRLAPDFPVPEDEAA